MSSALAPYAIRVLCLSYVIVMFWSRFHFDALPSHGEESAVKGVAQIPGGGGGGVIIDYSGIEAGFGRSCNFTLPY